MCVRIAIDLGLFELIVEHGGLSKGPISAEELAKRSQAEQLLIGGWSVLYISSGLVERKDNEFSPALFMPKSSIHGILGCVCWN